MPAEFHQDYFDSDGAMVNPWGGVEAIFTHALSLLFGMPTAHSPMIESEEIESIDPGSRRPADGGRGGFAHVPAVDPQGPAAQPPDRDRTSPVCELPGCLTARDVSCLVIPDGCLGLPVLAALEQGIPVIAVRDPDHLMANDLAALPWSPGQFCRVDNYLEAVGALCARRAGLALDSVRRPILPAPVAEVVTRRGGSRRSKSSGDAALVKSDRNGPSIPIVP